MASIKTPCLGICSTTSVGDVVCRGCKRYAFEVIDWNGYDDEAMAAMVVNTLIAGAEAPASALAQLLP